MDEPEAAKNLIKVAMHDGVVRDGGCVPGVG